MKEVQAAVVNSAHHFRTTQEDSPGHLLLLPYQGNYYRVHVPTDASGAEKRYPSPLLLYAQSCNLTGWNQSYSNQYITTSCHPSQLYVSFLLGIIGMFTGDSSSIPKSNKTDE